MAKKADFRIVSLGPCGVRSPLEFTDGRGGPAPGFVSDGECILYDIEISRELAGEEMQTGVLLEKAGPREMIYFDPSKVHAAIVTCGGLCPGLNDVIRSIVMCLWYRYGTKRICGIRYGYRGFLPKFGIPEMELTPDMVMDIHRQGGTILGSSRGYGDRVTEIVNAMEQMNINMLFAIGGDGTQKGAYNIAAEVNRRGLKIAVVGVPKTIDNDLSYIQKSFGFETAVSEAVAAVAGAHVEARDGVNGVGIVKVMGRDSGFIAAYTALAINDVNYVLIPEASFDLEGGNGLLANLERRLATRGHAVILVAEGAGQEHFAETGQDASGNKKLGDIGVFLKNRINEYFKAKGIEITLKYIDPGYMIRSAPANPNDAIYCARLGGQAVHAAMAGKTGLIISLMHDHFVHVPIPMATAKRNRIDPQGDLWRDVTEATGQPLLLKERRTRPRAAKEESVMAEA